MTPISVLAQQICFDFMEKIGPAVVVAAVLLASCSGGISADEQQSEALAEEGLSAVEQELEALVAERLVSTDDMGITTAEVDCLASEIVTDLGVEKLQSMGFSDGENVDDLVLDRDSQSLWRASRDDGTYACLDNRVRFERLGAREAELCALEQLSDDDVEYLLRSVLGDAEAGEIKPGSAEANEVEERFDSASAKCSE